MLWTRLAVVPLLLMTWGCATRGVSRLPVNFCEPKPPLVADSRLTSEGVAWILDCINAGRLNCVAIQANNGDDVKKCDIVPKKP